MLAPELHLRIVGLLLLGIAALSVYVPRRFGWKAETRQLTLLTRQVFEIHCVAITMVVALMGVLLVGYAGELTAPGPLPRAILVGLIILWAARMFAQWFFYDAALWRGNRLNTVMHVVFSVVYTYCVAAFVFALVTQLRG